jgi:membrane protease YdiL (CAAX protease family)
VASTRTAPSTDGATSVSEIERGGGRREPAPSAAYRRERQKDEFGGFSWLSTLAGWLSAAGLTAILTGILSAAGAALALNQVGSKVSGSEADTIGIAGGIALLVALAIAYLFGGYVAGRMARFDGARQGVGVWLWGILIALVVAALALIGGSKYNVLDALNLPRLPVDSGTLTTGGLVALAASLVVTLGAAILGGKTGERFHKKVDRA